jgi:hypothetical protein
MRRWLIALFACHFLLGVVGFGISDHIVDVPRVGVGASAADGTAQPAWGAPIKGLNDLAHALADELPDLPDSLQRRAAPALSHVMTPTQPAATIAALPEPVLAGLFRPPRTA